MATPVNPRTLLTHRNAIVAFTRYVAQARQGGLMNAALEMLIKVLPLKGALAYRKEENGLVLVGDHQLPRRAKAWLSHLPVTPDGWFVAQRVADSFKPTVDLDVAQARMGHSLKPVLEEGGWKAVAAAPIALGRELFGVVVLAADGPAQLDEHTMLLLETICSLLALGEEREKMQQKEKDARVDETNTAQLATVGLLAATAACELAAPLGGMQMQLEEHDAILAELRAVLYAKLGEDIQDVEELDNLRTVMEAIGTGVRSAQGVASRLLSFSRESVKQPVDMVRVLEWTLDILGPVILGGGIKLEVEIPDDELLVEGRQEVLQMLVAQLLLYAKQEVDQTTTRGALIRVGMRGDRPRYQLTVETSSAEERSTAQIFDTYVTRNRGNKAMVGLALAKQAVVTHGGHIEHGNSELGGVLIRVVLPASTAGLEADSVPAPRPSRPQMPRPQLGGALPVMLWVEEDQRTALTLRQFIETHEVVAATSLAEARELMARGPAVIFCEVNLPDGSAIDLHQESPQDVRERFVFMTGGVIPAGVASYLVASGRPTLIKPIAAQEIAQLLSDDAEGMARVSHTLDSVPPPGAAKPPPQREDWTARRRQASTVDITRRPKGDQ
jgi:signal transduction histidine kinase